VRRGKERDSEESSYHAESYADFVSLIVPVLRDFIPILLERWSEFANRPTLRSMEEDQRRLQNQIDLLEKRVQWLTIFQIISALFFFFLVVLLVLKVI
jgi:hypothetical protein